MKSIHHLSIVAKILAIGVILSCVSISAGAQKKKKLFQPPALSKIAPPPPVDSQPPPRPHVGWLRLRNIIITGNKRTKEYIIKREMNLKAGDSILIANLTKKLEQARAYIYNTTLFVTVKVEPILLNAFQFDIIVTVKERFYVFPVPQFQLVDRSVDEWLTKYNGSLKRVNYGLKFVHYNLSGRKDQLRLFILNGYSRNISLSYNAPYSNAKLTEGYYVSTGFSQTKEIAYKTDYNNSLMYYNNGGFVRDLWFINGGYTIRKAIKKSQIINASFSHLRISDSILSNNLNPGYFNKGSSSQNIIDFGYTLQYVDVNNILYPLEGISHFVSFQKRGLGLTKGINMFSVEGQYNRFISLGQKWYTSVQVAGKIKLPFNQPYVNQQALGDKNAYLRGLDYYTIDGVAFGTAKFNIKKEVLNFTLPTFIKSKTYNKIPFKFYAKIFSDFGYVYGKQQPASRLNNKLLATAGVGIDILTLYDLHIRLDYSFNQLGQSRLAVNNRPGF